MFKILQIVLHENNDLEFLGCDPNELFGVEKLAQQRVDEKCRRSAWALQQNDWFVYKNHNLNVSKVIRTDTIVGIAFEIIPVRKVEPRTKEKNNDRMD